MSVGARLRVGDVALVALGGAVGTAARALLTFAIPTPGGFPLGILLINIVGSFLLGFVVSLLSGRGADSGRRRAVRLGVGVGVIGGFTTYSAVAVELAMLVGAAPWMAVGYFVATVGGGATASLLGMVVGGWRRRAR